MSQVIRIDVDVYTELQVLKQRLGLRSLSDTVRVQSADARRYALLQECAEIEYVLDTDTWHVVAWAYDGSPGVAFADRDLDRLLDDVAEFHRRVLSPDEVGHEAAGQSLRDWETWYEGVRRARIGRAS